MGTIATLAIAPFFGAFNLRRNPGKLVRLADSLEAFDRRMSAIEDALSLKGLDDRLVATVLAMADTAADGGMT